MKIGQTSLEYLLVAGFTIVVVVIGMMLVWQSGILVPEHQRKGKIGFSDVMVVEWAAYHNSELLALNLENNLPDTVIIFDIRAIMDRVNCTYTGSPITLKPSGKVMVGLNCSDLSVRYIIGNYFDADITITYNNTRTGTIHKSKGKVWSKIEKGQIPSTTSTTTTTSTTISAAALSCVVRNTDCNPGEVCVFRMFSTSDAHTGTCSGSSYTYRVCCSVSSGALSLDASCSQAGVISLHSTDDSHVEKYGLGNYNNDICLSYSLGTISCYYSNNCGGDTCLASMYQDTDSHVGDCNYNPAKRICCKIT